MSVSERDFYEALKLAYEKQQDLAIPRSDGAKILVPFSTVKMVYETNRDAIEEALHEEHNPFGLELGDFFKNPLDSDISNIIDEEFSDDFVREVNEGGESEDAEKEEGLYE